MGRENIRHIHLIGICGTAMGGLAGLLSARGDRVTGSDQDVYPPMSDYLENLGIRAGAGFREEHLDPTPDLVVIGNAIRRGNPEAEATLDRRIPFTSLPAFVSEHLLPGKKPAVVAGTHGKTTTASMLAHALMATGADPSFLIGGIPLGAGAPSRLGAGEAFVLEGDEYETAFFDKGPKIMHYFPDVGILNAVEMDHADIFADLDTVKLQFRRWVNIIPRRALLLVYGDDPNAVDVASRAHCRVETFGEGAANVWRLENLLEGGAGTEFDLARRPGDAAATRGGGAEVLAVGVPAAARAAPEVAKRQALDTGGQGRATNSTPLSPDRAVRVHVRIPSAGAFNARNAAAAIVAASELGVPIGRAAEAMASFPGVRRRLEVRGEVRGVVVVDDFAHHPTAIRETLRAARARWSGRRLVAVLEPRSWSLRRRLFQNELPAALSEADIVVVASVYKADALPPEERLDVPALVRDLAARGVPARHGENAASIVASLASDLRQGDVVLVMSNGGFDGLHDRLLAALRS